MAVKKSELYSSLWESCDKLRGGMDASQYKDYVLVMLFIKYVSDKYAGQPFAPITIPSGASFDDMVKLKGKMDIGDRINKEIIAPLAEANQLVGTITVADFDSAEKLGSPKAKRDTLTELIAVFENPDLDFSKNKADDDDILGDAYEFLMRHFATESGKSKGQFYTPSEVSRILARILQIPKSKHNGETMIYDPTCGSGSLLLKVATETNNKATVFGQEKDVANAGLARMNMVLHGNAAAVRNIKTGDTISEPQFKVNPTQLKQFDYIVANPPFSTKNWSSGIEPENDEFDRFELGIPPEKNGDYAFLLHMLRSLKRNGKAAVILPHGVLFRGHAEESIRMNLIKKGFIKGVIGLPANLFYGTGIPACIILMDKEGAADRKHIFMMDGSKGFIKDGNKNRLREQDLHKIVAVFNSEKELDKYSRKVSIEEIEKNEYNLNIPRYINTQEDEDIQDLHAHLNGGIPVRDIDALNNYWNVYPSLRVVLFEKRNENYVDLKVDKFKIKETIYGHEKFKDYSKQFNNLLDAWQNDTAALLKKQGKDCKPKELISQIGEDLLMRFSDIALVNKYDVYQHLMDYWNDIMQDDLYVIASDGWEIGKVPGRKIKSTKNKGVVTHKPIEGIEGIESKLISSELLIEKYFKTEYQAILDKEAKTEEVKAKMEELEEENNGDNGDTFQDCRGGKGAITKGALETCIKVNKDKESFKVELKIWNEYLDLFKEEAKIKNEAKEERKKLEKLVWEKYKTLSMDEIQQIVLDMKWLGNVKAAINTEMESISQRLTTRIKELGERYDTKLGDLASETQSLESKVSEHLKKMGLAWS
jgi:type I restriction enzyme M protein